MAEVPAEWLEKMAAEAAKRMKKQPWDEKPVGTTQAPQQQQQLLWMDYSNRRGGTLENDIPFMCLVDKNGARIMKIYIHSKQKNKYWFNMLEGKEDRPTGAHLFAVIPSAMLHALRDWLKYPQ